MKKKTHLLLIAVAIVSLISSCSMEKRLYLPGYNVEWKKSDISKRNMDFAYENLTTKEQAVENPQLFPEAFINKEMFSNQIISLTPKRKKVRIF